MKNSIFLIFYFFLTPFVYSQQDKETLLRTILSDIQPDSLMRTVTDLQQMGTRFCFNTQTNKRVAVYLKDRYEQIGYTQTGIDSFYLHEYDFFLSPEPLSGWQYNFTAVLEGKSQPEKICILGAHLDDISYHASPSGRVLDPYSPGADDNATGIAVALEVARLFKKYDFQPEKTIRFMAYDAEEVGLHGSRWAAKKSDSLQEKIVFFLNNDMVGNKPVDPSNWFIKLLPYDNAFDLLSYAYEVCKQYTRFTPVFFDTNSRGSDSYAYYEKGYKSIFIHESNFSSVYHSLSDSISYIDPAYLAEATKLSLALLFLEKEKDYLGISYPRKKAGFTASVYPNPAYTQACVYLSVHSPQTIHIELYSVSGEKLFSSQAYFSISDNMIYLPIQNLSSGVYICTIQSEKGRKTMKLIIRK